MRERERVCVSRERRREKQSLKQTLLWARSPLPSLILQPWDRNLSQNPESGVALTESPRCPHLLLNSLNNIHQTTITWQACYITLGLEMDNTDVVSAFTKPQVQHRRPRVNKSHAVFPVAPQYTGLQTSCPLLPPIHGADFPASSVQICQDLPLPPLHPVQLRIHLYGSQWL